MEWAARTLAVPAGHATNACPVDGQAVPHPLPYLACLPDSALGRGPYGDQ